MKLSNILFLDIETVSAAASYDGLSEKMKSLWGKKAQHLVNKEIKSDQELYEERAAIYSEFGKVVCVGIGYITEKEGVYSARVKAIAGHDEKSILKKIAELLSSNEQLFTFLCAHNGKEFDFPYLSRRMLVNQVPLPPQLDIGGKKPWEVLHLDTMELWKFGDRKNFTSLDLLAELLEIESPKQDMDGSMVSRAYHQDNALDKITEYCKRDVAALINVYLKMNYQAVIPNDRIEMI